jgi:MacB-like periplasmic core domain
VNASAHAYIFRISPGYFRAAGTALLSGRDFSWRDDKNSPLVAVVNGEFARRLFGSPDSALGRSYKMRDATRIQIVGVSEDRTYPRRRGACDGPAGSSGHMDSRATHNVG